MSYTKKMMFLGCYIWLGFCSHFALIHAQESEQMSLNGNWRFALDPLGQSEALGWHLPDLNLNNWDEVDVPHTWSVDRRYQYIGKTMYRKTIKIPAEYQDQHIRLAFDAVYYRCRVWVNGKLMKEHEGGNTSFRIDISNEIEFGEENTIAVEVDNSWDLETLPGARPGTNTVNQVYPWWDYGGIIRDVYLLINEPVYVENQKVTAQPDLDLGTADIEAAIWIKNSTGQPREGKVGLELRYDGEKIPLKTWLHDDALVKEDIRIMPHSVETVRLQINLAEEEVKLWHPDHPNLYELHTVFQSAEGSEHLHKVTIGIRSIEIKNAQFLLNGEPIKMGGANRHSDHPKFGSLEPDQVIQQDMKLMKDANMEFSRLHHYPTAKKILEWADRNGMLIIAEAGNWQLHPDQMDSPIIREKFQYQLEEMLKNDWNHPSIIGWSVGNEFNSNSESGVRWIQDMSDVIRNLDSSRPITFASHGSRFGNTHLASEQDGSHYVDFLCPNLYYDIGETSERLDNAHERWPEKPILICEWGQRADLVESEDQRVRYNKEFMEMVRKREYVIGAAIWTFNDYRSRYPGTNPDGFRHWGTVDAERQPRESHYALRKEFAPVMISGQTEKSDDQWITTVQITGRDDFPRYTLRDYRLYYELMNDRDEILDKQKKNIDILKPGETQTFLFHSGIGENHKIGRIKINIERPTGFSMIDYEIDMTED